MKLWIQESCNACEETRLCCIITGDEVVMHRSDRFWPNVLNVRPFFCVQVVLTGSAKMKVRTQNIKQNISFLRWHLLKRDFYGIYSTSHANLRRFIYQQQLFSQGFFRMFAQLKKFIAVEVWYAPDFSASESFVQF